MINREVHEEEITPGSTLKDKNLLKLTNEETLLLFQQKDGDIMKEQIYFDIKFLCTHNLMDYSLLVIIETNPKWIEAKEKRTTTMKHKGETQQMELDVPQVKVKAEKSKLNSLSNFVDKLVEEFNMLGLGNRHKYISSNGRYFYHIAIIDYLQAYNLEKRLENAYKVYIKNSQEFIMILSKSLEC